MQKVKTFYVFTLGEEIEIYYRTVPVVPAPPVAGAVGPPAVPVVDPVDVVPVEVLPVVVVPACPELVEGVVVVPFCIEPVVPVFIVVDDVSMPSGENGFGRPGFVSGMRVNSKSWRLTNAGSEKIASLSLIFWRLSSVVRNSAPTAFWLVADVATVEAPVVPPVVTSAGVAVLPPKKIT
jgi:hypothetical protein